jgi:hypothetical protein
MNQTRTAFRRLARYEDRGEGPVGYLMVATLLAILGMGAAGLIRTTALARGSTRSRT